MNMTPSTALLPPPPAPSAISNATLTSSVTPVHSQTTSYTPSASPPLPMPQTNPSIPIPSLHAPIVPNFRSIGLVQYDNGDQLQGQCPSQDVFCLIFQSFPCIDYQDNTIDSGEDLIDFSHDACVAGCVY
eukprot:CCRYP_019387-RA/>CCRYP_019387-RA protein AED:0.37 eAED:0.37 QI:0/-1/0/1/-1/1/1/0/129